MSSTVTICDMWNGWSAGSNNLVHVAGGNPRLLEALAAAAVHVTTGRSSLYNQLAYRWDIPAGGLLKVSDAVLLNLHQLDAGQKYPCTPCLPSPVLMINSHTCLTP